MGVSRRHFIGLLGTISLPLSGCLGSDVEDVLISNSTDQSVTVDLEIISNDGDSVINDTLVLQSSENDGAYYQRYADVGRDRINIQISVRGGPNNTFKNISVGSGEGVTISIKKETIEMLKGEA